jgi:hypothetical protein
MMRRRKMMKMMLARAQPRSLKCKSNKSTKNPIYNQDDDLGCDDVPVSTHW